MKPLNKLSVNQLFELYKRREITLTQIPEYKVYNGMIQRCLNPKATNYHRYGGRGITVHKHWIWNFWNWFRYIGRRPKGYSIERMDNNRGYVPGNVRWANKQDQANNKRCSPLPFTFEGELTRRI